MSAAPNAAIVQPPVNPVSALRGFFLIADAWGVTHDQARILLGAPPEPTYYAWRTGKAAQVPMDTLRRIGYVAGIYKALQILYSDPTLADSWVRGSNLAFSGQSPLERMCAGDVTDLAAVRQYLDAARAPWSCGVSTRLVIWPQAWRIIALRDPPISLFERLTPDPSVWEALIAVEQMTNPHLRDEVGDIRTVPPDDRVAGPGASYVMASFTHVNPKRSRFSDGTYGVYYAAATLETAIAETVFPFEIFARDSADPVRTEDMRALVGSVETEFEDAAAVEEPQRSHILDPDDYSAAQSYGRGLRAKARTGSSTPACVGREGNASARSSRARCNRRSRSVTCNIDGTEAASTAISTIRATRGFRSENRIR